MKTEAWHSIVTLAVSWNTLEIFRLPLFRTKCLDYKQLLFSADKLYGLKIFCHLLTVDINYVLLYDVLTHYPYLGPAILNRLRSRFGPVN
jgi:hypothetical protein